MVRPLATLIAASAVAAAMLGCGSPATTTAPTGATAGAGGTSTSSSGGFAATDSNPAGDIPDTQAFVITHDPQARFTVRVPEGWARSDGGAASTLSDHYNSVRIETVAAASAPTVESAQTAELPGIRSSGVNVAMPQVTVVQRTAGAVVFIAYTADSAPDPVTGKVARVSVERYEYWRNGVEAIVTLSSPVGSDNVDPWRKVTDSFTWT